MSRHCMARQLQLYPTKGRCRETRLSGSAPLPPLSAHSISPDPNRLQEPTHDAVKNSSSQCRHRTTSLVQSLQHESLYLNRVTSFLCTEADSK